MEAEMTVPYLCGHTMRHWYVGNSQQRRWKRLRAKNGYCPACAEALYRWVDAQGLPRIEGRWAHKAEAARRERFELARENGRDPKPDEDPWNVTASAFWLPRPGVSL